MTKNKTILWVRWTAANALAELVGLGGTFAVIGLLVSRIDTRGTGGILLAFAITVACGAIEATIVGLVQHSVMRSWFPAIGRWAWWRATLIGALLGYVLGYLPSTLMSVSETVTQAPQAEPPQWVTLLLAAGLGAAAGALLSFAQWLVLRGKARKAGLWIPANMLAWAVGMPIIFAGMELAFKSTETWQIVLVIAGTLLTAGICVGAIHGRFLVAITSEPGK